MKLSTKVFFILVPLFFIAVVLIAYFNYINQEEQMLEQARASATAHAATIRESLVNMMVTNEIVDDNYLQKLKESGSLYNIQILFKADSLHLDESYHTPQRFKRLLERESKTKDEVHLTNVSEAITKGEPVWELSCLFHEHRNYTLHDSAFTQSPWLNSCEQLVAEIPFKAEKKCLQCHNVSRNTVLGVAHIELSLASTSVALRKNAERSLLVFFGFTFVAILMGTLVFRKMISNPLDKLVYATEVIGGGNFEHHFNDEKFSSKEFDQLAGSFIDMQDRLQKAQQELIQRERLSTVGQMASTIIHDFRTPMSSIMLATDSLKISKNITEERQGKLFGAIYQSIEKMNRMMRELLDYSRGEFKLNFEEVPVSSFLETMVGEIKEYLQTKNIRLTVQHNFHGSMHIDKERIHRALLNIITNAEDAMQYGGTIEIIAEEKSSSLLISIRDTGGGIPEEIKTTMFEPFATFGKKKGTGLGLAITKKVVDLHHGTLSFESELGKGTTFFISLPLKNTLS